MRFRIKLEKENFKFSCSHFTIMGPGRAERLHGHNYYVGVELGLDDLDPTLGMAFDFNAIKPLVRNITESYDEMVLLPELSPYLKIERGPKSIRATLGDAKTYELPTEDVKTLPCVNITSEELSRQIAERLATQIRAIPAVSGRVRSLAVNVQETRGQSVTYEISL